MMRDPESKRMIDEWLKKALHKIDTMPRDELLKALEEAGMILHENEEIDNGTTENRS